MFTKSIRSRLFAGLIFPALLALQACQNTDTVVFVTATDVGLKADPTTGAVKIGYGRGDILVGPDFPEKGTVPDVFAYSDSNLSVLTPKVKQLYATGEAAVLVVTPKNELPNPPSKGDELTGIRRPLFFGTGTNFGLEIGVSAPNPRIKFGLNREEISIIPLQPKATDQTVEALPSVLAAINLDQEAKAAVANSINASTVEITEFFATGNVAKQLARSNADIRALYIHTAASASQDASNVSAATRSSIGKIEKYFDAKGADNFVAAKTALLSDPRITPYTDRVKDLQLATNKDEFLKRLYTVNNLGVIPILDDIASSLTR